MQIFKISNSAADRLSLCELDLKIVDNESCWYVENQSCRDLSEYAFRVCIYPHWCFGFHVIKKEQAALLLFTEVSVVSFAGCPFGDVGALCILFVIVLEFFCWLIDSIIGSSVPERV
jgi:hypothetical protein